MSATGPLAVQCRNRPVADVHNLVSTAMNCWHATPHCPGIDAVQIVIRFLGGWAEPLRSTGFSLSNESYSGDYPGLSLNAPCVQCHAPNEEAAFCKSTRDARS